MAESSSGTVVRKCGRFRSGGKGVGCEGEVELLQDGINYFLRFRQLSVWSDEEVDEFSDGRINVGLFVSDVKLKPKKAANPTVRNFEAKVWPQAIDQGVTAEDALGNVIEGLLPECGKPEQEDFGDEEVKVVEEPQTHRLDILQQIDPEEWPDDTALDIRSILFAKLYILKGDWPVETDSAVVYGYAFLEEAHGFKVKTKKELKARREAQSELQQQLANSTTWEKGKSLLAIQKYISPRLKYYDKDGSGDISFHEFKAIYENLGIFINQASLLRLFKRCDLDKSGSLDLEELPLTLYVYDRLDLKPYTLPLHTFMFFDTDQSGELNEHEFYEVLETMNVTTLSKDQASRLFAKWDKDDSGVIDYEEFKTLWLTMCNVKEELEKREALKDAKRRVGLFTVQRSGAFRKILRECLDREEAEDKEMFESAYQEALKENRALRLQKDMKIQQRNREKRQERVMDKLARSKRERQEREEKAKERRELQKIAIREKQFREELENEIKEQSLKDKARREHEQKERLQAEAEERARKGEDRIDISYQGLRQVPEEFYASKLAQSRLVHLIVVDMSHNKLDSLPDRLLFWCSSVRKFDVSNNHLKELCSEIGALENVQLVDVSNNRLTVLPEESTRMKKLVKLSLGGNLLRNLDKRISDLPDLKVLLCNRNKLESITEAALHGLTNLKVLDLSLNALKALPNSLGKLPCLESLNLSWNSIRKLPADLSGLQQLQVLDVSNNEIRRLPESLSQVKVLEVFKASHNEIVELPLSFGEMGSLLELDLSDNRLSALPDTIGGLQSLQTIYLSRNTITVLPATFGQLRHLAKLQCVDNKMVYIPQEMGALCSLSELLLQNNHLVGDIPASFGAIQNLAVCNLSNNKITALPNTLAGMVFLKELNVANNQIRVIPTSLCSMHSLERLDFSSNLLKKLPLEIARLQDLEELDLSSNLLEWLPQQLAALKKLKRLELRHNKLHALPPSLAELIRRLDVFSVKFNPLDGLPKKWCKNWDDLHNRSEEMWSGYTDSEAVAWVQKMAVVAPSVTRFARSDDVMVTSKAFISAVKASLGPSTVWNERYENYVKSYYFATKKKGVTPQFAYLNESEQDTRSSYMRKKEQEQSALKEAAKAEEARARALVEEKYAVSHEHLREVDCQLDYRRRQIQLLAKRQELEHLNRTMAECFTAQEKAAKEIDEKRQAERHAEYQMWLEFFNEQRQEAEGLT